MPPPITIAAIQRWTGERSYGLGLSYVRGGAISSPRRQDRTLKALCQGSRPGPYHVEATLADEDVVWGHCSCPVGGGGRCKHAAALLIAWRDDPGAFVEVEDLDLALERLSKPMLLALMRRLLRRSLDLQVLLELELSILTATEAPVAEDTQDIRQQVRRLVSQAGSRRGSLIDVDEDLRRFLDLARGTLDGGDALGAAGIYQAIVETLLEYQEEAEDLEDDYDRYDDYGYEEEEPDNDEALGQVIGECVAGLGRCLRATDGQALRASILRTLVDVYTRAAATRDSYLDRALFDRALDDDLYAPEDQPEDEPEDQPEAGHGTERDVAAAVILARATPQERQRVAALVQDALPKGQAWGDTYVRQRYGRFVLELIGDTLDDEAYLRLCREADLLPQRLERLLVRGRASEAAAAVREVEERQLLAMADVFVHHDQGPLIARVIRERADASQTPGLLTWLKQYAKQTGDNVGALALAETLFWLHPSVEGYREIEALARPLERWDMLRQEISARLTREKLYDVQTELYLAEGELDRALEALDNVPQGRPGYLVATGYSPVPLRIRVAQAAEVSRPEAAIRLYLQESERLIALQGRENYAVAASHLARVRDIYGRQGRGQAWQTLIGRLREQHRRLRALRDELEKATLFEPESAPAPEQPAETAREATKPPVVRLVRPPGAPGGR